MPLDVYGLTRRRDATTLNRFLDEYVDRAANADRGDEDLLLEPLGGRSDSELMTWESEPSRTLTHMVERGLDYPRRAFTIYLKPLAAHLEVGIERVIVGFTRDDQLVLGMTVFTGHDMREDEEEAGEEQAHDLLTHFSDAYQCYLGLILSETPPPLSEAEFREPGDSYHVEFSASFDV